ncbi:MAG: hypothetical protein KDA91_08495 [Planctomycetaceae bacterium]|nr:hypothetical protein [Planctomycetaceae bacterium]
MDQLKPLIKHHYWICFVLSVIFVVVGWWMASGSLAEATTARKSSIEASFTKAKEGANAPNLKWIEAAKAKNDQDVTAYEKSSRSLWQRQKEVRVWPETIAADMKGIAFGEKIPNVVTRGKWGVGYGKQFDELLEIVDPFDMKDGSGLVLVNKQAITHKPYNTWRNKKPLSDEIWKNQEDLWLLKSLLSSLSRVNSGANRITESSLRQIVALRLRGGDPEASPAPVGGAAGGMGMPGGFGGSSGGFGLSTGGGEGGEGDMYGSARTGSGPWAAFEGSFGMDFLSEEFGPDSSGGAGAGMGGMGGMEMGLGEMNSDMYGGGGFGGSGGIGGAKAEEKRYVHDAENLGYKTRAFFLHVKIREDQIARLLAELTTSDFPVEIVRVDLKTTTGPAMSGGGFGGGGMEGLGGPDMGSDMGSGMGSDMYGSGYAGEMGDPLGGVPGAGQFGEDPGFGSDGFGGEGYGSDGYGAGFAGGAEAKTGQQVLSAAMQDPALVELRVGGLMTIYETPEEREAQSETEAAAGEESMEAGGNTAVPEVTDGSESSDGTGDSSPPAETLPDAATENSGSSTDPGNAADAGSPSDGSVESTPGDAVDGNQ